MESKMELWDKLKKTDPTYIKPITGGKLEKLGYSQIDPTYRIMQLTQVLGPCGQGWAYRVARSEWTPVGNDVLHSIEVAFKWKMDNGEWSEEFSGVGSTFVSKQGDETAKSSLTDALTNAATKIGQIAEILLGKYDGSKYDKKETLEDRQIAAVEAYLGNNMKAMKYYLEGYKLSDKSQLDNPKLLGIYQDLVKNNRLTQIK